MPSCGVLLGIATDPPTNEKLHAVETLLGTRFPMVHRFHDLNDTVPTRTSAASVQDGRILQLSIDARIYGRPLSDMSWAAVAEGRYDAQLKAQAAGVAGLHRPVFVTFGHEPDLPRHSVLGPPSDFRAAWRHVHAVFERAGATNAVWVWVVTGSPATDARAVQMWPGNAFVDWISWESYNAAGCRAGAPDYHRSQSFAETTLSFLRYLRQVHGRYDIDLAKPIMISEAGSTTFGNPALTSDWYRQIPDVLRANPQIRAVSLWDHRGTGVCDYRFDNVPAVAESVRILAHSSVISGG